jgi:hypothetical protein
MLTKWVPASEGLERMVFITLAAGEATAILVMVAKAVTALRRQAELMLLAMGLAAAVVVQAILALVKAETVAVATSKFGSLEHDYD